MKKILALFTSLFFVLTVYAQPMQSIKWNEKGDGYFQVAEDGIWQIFPKEEKKELIVEQRWLFSPTSKQPLKIENFFFTSNRAKVLIFTNSERVWRYNTRGDYWVLDLKTKKLTQLGKGLPAASLMYAKFSPDGNSVAYVAKHNIYVENLKTQKRIQLTKDGTDRIINGTFDWAYEEEFGARDGFRWSPDGKSIAFWRVDARKIRNFLMINNTDSVYAYTIPVEYPKVGYAPSSTTIGIVQVATGKTVWSKIEGSSDNNYLPRMEWANNNEIVVQQLNRKQNHSKLYSVNITTGKSSLFYEEKNNSWIDIKSRWHDDNPVGWDWLAGNRAFLWMSEQDGWRHIYQIDTKGAARQITKGNFDVIDMLAVNEEQGDIYILASPDNATQQYLYKVKIDGSKPMEKLSPETLRGTHDYDISPSGQLALHTFSNVNTPSTRAMIFLPNHAPASEYAATPTQAKVEIIKIKTADSVEMDATIMYPQNFDENKKYPVVFYVYSEPGSCTVKDAFGRGRPYLYDGDMAKDGYIYISVDSRGTPAPKGAAWRKAIYQKVGILNVHDQAAAAKEIRKWKFVDSTRMAVWGWSGGGSTTLNLLFQHADVFQTGIAIAPVANRLTYDNIYEERYMGLPQENIEVYHKASAIQYAKGLKGNLLLIHGTGDDNVHYQNAEMLIDELVKHGKVFQMMSYPNRSHSINEGEGTRAHLKKIFTQFLKKHCPPGAR